jgi:hypothetical protein
MKIRAGSVADLDSALALMDEPIDWLVEQRRTGQRAAKPFSRDKRKTEFTQRPLEQGDLFTADTHPNVRPRTLEAYRCLGA